MKYLLPLLLLLSLRLSAQTKKPTSYIAKDTIISYTRYDTTVCAIYVMKCDSCEPVIQAAFKVQSQTFEDETKIYINRKTGERSNFPDEKTWIMSSGGRWYSNPKKFVKYLRYDKTEFEKGWIILKEKHLQ